MSKIPSNFFHLQSLEIHTMSSPALTIPALPLPSDQDASGRTLGEEEIRNLTDVIRSGTLTSTKGNFVKQLESPLGRTARNEVRLRLLARLGGDSLRRGRRRLRSRAMKSSLLRSPIWAPSLPFFTRRNSGLCRCRSGYLQCHAGTIERSAEPADQSGHRHAPVREPCDMTGLWTSADRAGHRSDRGLRAGFSGASSGSACRHDRRHWRLQLAAGQAHYNR